MSPEAAAYLTEILDYIQQYAVKSREMDWETIRSETLAQISDAEAPVDTYPAIRRVLALLGDRHSYLLSPQTVQWRDAGGVTSVGLLAVYPEGVIVRVHPGSPAAQAGLQVRDIIETINGESAVQLDRVSFKRALSASPITLTIRRENQGERVPVTLHAAPYICEMKPQGRVVEPDIGYIELPGVTGSDSIRKTYAEIAQQYIREMDQAGIRHWIIDLRRNTGGDMWTMLAGVDALLGDEECGFFLAPDGTQTSWRIQKATWVKTRIREPYSLAHTPIAIAVLTSRLTCSSGEFTTLAFRGYPQARSFGEPTAGLPTANRMTILKDGAQLFLTVACGMDRTGRAYGGPILPDEPVASDWILFQTEHDPVVRTAGEWVRGRPLEHHPAS